MKKRDLIIVIILSIIIGFMYISGLPLALLSVNYKDIQNFIIPIGLNIILCVLIVYSIIKIFKVNLNFRIRKDNLLKGIKETILISSIVIVFYGVEFFINYSPLNNSPSIIRLLLEGIVYYSLTAIIEELLLRGLLFNFFNEIFKKSKNRILIAAIISSLLFAIGHVPSVLNQGLLVCLFRFIYPFSMGLGFAYFYKKTDNLLIPIIYHFIGSATTGIICCFSNIDWTTFDNSQFFYISVTIFSLLISVYFVNSIRKLDKK